MSDNFLLGGAILLVAFGLIALPILSWLRTRPSRRQVRQELYGFLCSLGAVVVAFAFMAFAFSYLPGPHWFWGLVGFAGLFWTVSLIHVKFERPWI
jgi:hypothetical protein